MEKKNNDSFIRWQTTTINQFGYTVNIILTLSIATLGFETSLLLNDNYNPNGFCKVLFFSSFLLSFFSIGVGLFCIINRLLDFRYTTEITKIREDTERVAELSLLRRKVKTLGNRTWCLFYWQVGSFVGGITILVLSVGYTYIEKII